MSVKPAAYNVIPLDPESDPRIESLKNALLTVINERAAGKIPVVTVVGVLEALKWRVISNGGGEDL